MIEAAARHRIAAQLRVAQHAARRMRRSTSSSRLLALSGTLPSPDELRAAGAAPSGSDGADVADAGAAGARTAVARRGIRARRGACRSRAPRDRRAGAECSSPPRRCASRAGAGGQQRRRRTRHIWCSTGVPERRRTASPAWSPVCPGRSPARSWPRSARTAAARRAAGAGRRCPACRSLSRARSTSSRRRRSSSARGRPHRNARRHARRPLRRRVKLRGDGHDRGSHRRRRRAGAARHRTRAA